MTRTEIRSGGPSPAIHFLWVDLFKGIALAWIFITHVAERLLGAPYLANPMIDWPPLDQRVAQLVPLQGHGLLDILLNLFRYIGWAGDHGVQLFLIVSGFGLTWGLMVRYGRGAIPTREFYRRRFLRLFPEWWGAHIIFALIGLLTGWGLSLLQPAFYLSLIGVRFTADRMYYFAPAWWFIGLLIQLYLIYPLLWAVLRKRGPLWLLIASCGVAFAARAIGLLVFKDYLDAWSRGAILITRLPEFVFGISVAAWMYQDLRRTDQILRKPSTVGLGLIALVLGLILALTLIGMTVALFLIGVGMFVLLYRLFGHLQESKRWSVRAGTWIGRHSYSLYLMHQPFILLFVVDQPAADRPWLMAVVGVAIALALTCVSAIALEKSVNWVEVKIVRWWKRSGVLGMALRFAGIVLVLFGVLLGAELLVERFAPQEVYGWGEKAALEPSATFGWRLKPSSATHLRWLGYDYQVVANSLGFPEPEYPAQAPPATYRILVTGDAFTSAEGQDTDRSWARLLESNLEQRVPDRNMEVLNFAITGYGPNQYAAVIDQFAPIYRPDLILIEMFVNDYQDVLLSDADFQSAIGFDLPDQTGWSARLHLLHLRDLLRQTFIAPVAEWLTGQPDALGYTLGNFAAVERKRADWITSLQRVRDRLTAIRQAADAIGARVAIVMVPASIQVCTPNQLDYFPQEIDLNDGSRFDLDQPQRATQKLAQALHFGYYDLRPALRKLAVELCPYVPFNMHWTADGHRAAADTVADQLVHDGYFQEH